jgi:hypothetical protein
MLGFSPSRGWNYAVLTGGLNDGTVSLYLDPTTTTQGTYVLIGAATSQSVSTLLTSAANVDANLAGVLGINSSSFSYTVVSQISAGSAGLVPGSPLVVPSTLTTGQTWVPYAGAAATVIFVGTVPNESVCPNPTNGARIRYTYPGFDDTISFVPGCGITDLFNNGSGAEFALTSVATYASIGSLSAARRTESLTYIDTARSLLGLERSTMPGAAVFSKIFASR